MYYHQIPFLKSWSPNLGSYNEENIALNAFLGQSWLKLGIGEHPRFSIFLPAIH